MSFPFEQLQTVVDKIGIRSNEFLLAYNFIELLHKQKEKVITS